MRVFLIAFITEFLSSFVIVCNTRAFTEGNYLWTAVTESFFIAQSFFVARWMIEDKDARGCAAFMGFLLGGTIGALGAIFTSKHLYGRIGA